MQGSQVAAAMELLEHVKLSFKEGEAKARRQECRHGHVATCGDLGHRPALAKARAGSVDIRHVSKVMQATLLSLLDSWDVVQH